MSDNKTVSTIPARQTAPQQYPVAASYSFEQIQRMAVSFAKSGLYGVKDPDQALSLMLFAQASGRHPALIMMDYDIIQNRLAKKSTAMLRDFQASGGRVEWKEYTDTRVCGEFTHPLSPVPITVDWDMERAKKAGLAAKSGDMYTKFTRAMLRSRCISEGVRATAPDATEQMYTPEEVREFDAAAPAPQSLTDAVTAAAEEVTHELPADQLDDLIATLDVATRPELVAAYNAGVKILKEHGNEAQFKKFKGWRDDMLSAIESKGGDEVV